MLSPEDLDGFDSLSDAEKEVAEKFFTLGFEDGYDEGYDTCELESSSYTDGKDVGFQEGMERERQRIYSVLDMQMKWAEQEGKGNEYLRWKNVKEYLTPIDLEPWSEERWQEELSKDGM